MQYAITLLSLLSSNRHQYQQYVSCYEHEMYHLCQYESDTFSATCKHNNINIDALVHTAATAKYIQGGSGKSGPKDQVALHYYYTSPSHWCTTHEVSKL